MTSDKGGEMIVTSFVSYGLPGGRRIRFSERDRQRQDKQCVLYMYYCTIVYNVESVMYTFLLYNVDTTRQFVQQMICTDRSVALV